MNPILNKNLFLVKEHRGIFKAANSYDIIDPENQQTVMLCREPDLGIFTKIFRFTDYKTQTPFNIVITDTSGKPILRVKRGLTIFRSVVEVFDHNEVLIGRFRQRFLSIGGKFEVQDPMGQTLCMLKGKWSSWEFNFTKDELVLAKVSKKWAGFGRELFTSADNYMLEIKEVLPADDRARLLILAAVMCIDMVLKE
ncbi:MAG: LURP-one-related/scramblase family protein [Sphingobacteriaceae bacterium]